jgi:hypothetical protein
VAPTARGDGDGGGERGKGIDYRLGRMHLHSGSSSPSSSSSSSYTDGASASLVYGDWSEARPLPPSSFVRAPARRRWRALAWDLRMVSKEERAAPAWMDGDRRGRRGRKEMGDKRDSRAGLPRVRVGGYTTHG